jgi:hypothetical protein
MERGPNVSKLSLPPSSWADVIIFVNTLEEVTIYEIQINVLEDLAQT